MPTITKDDKILVTGANGYIAMWATRLFLERGYSVRGTVRSEDKAKDVKDYFKSIGLGDKLETFIVDDIVKEGAFDAAVKEFLGPAIQGTVGILKSANKNGKQVKRIVITSSTAAVMSPPDKPTLFSALDWNTKDPKLVEELGSNAHPWTIYRASKSLAEKGAWDYYEQHKNEVQWDLTVLNPPFPPIHKVESWSTLNTSMQSWYNSVVDGSKNTKEDLSDSTSWIDVRDAALAHVLSLEKTEAGGERIIITEVATANSIVPSPLPSHKLAIGFPDILEGERVVHIMYDKAKEERILGIKFRSILETTKDTLENFAKRGCKGDKVLITGANGYIAMWATRLFLERGYSVRGTVRSEDKAKFMKDYFSSLRLSDQFETTIVEDMVKLMVGAQEGAFDEAVKDVDAIAHLATPFPDNFVKEPEEILRPAVQGTVGILQSAIKNGNKVKRIIVTSSCAAVMARPEKPTRFSEVDWNTTAPKQVEEQGSNTPMAIIYRASKVLAEREAWKFYERHKNEVQWDLTVLNPPGVSIPHKFFRYLGVQLKDVTPSIHDVKSTTSLNTSLQIWCNYVVLGCNKTKQELSDSSCWVDVRDIGLAHVLALERPEAGGERIIVAEGVSSHSSRFLLQDAKIFTGNYIFQEWLDVANSITPPPFSSHRLPIGFPEILDDDRVYKITYDKSKEERILGIQFHTKLQTTKDTLEDFSKRGW
ncbi:hypothetical protein CVT25_005442 [Psilocybe cyanescens]|uniref:NAD-dependent epimerase/dehydratase domain-containing protein n=1 Tax=Psilocybe cyanescens TaxID=93625 RepID=A0A409XBW5_PSICY|nr:hypothetical protein CVT25_005442 [Psilocybe cyanescens]